jgi:peptidylprolyl isomerase
MAALLSGALMAISAHPAPVLAAQAADSSSGTTPRGEVIAQAGSITLDGADIRALIDGLPPPQRAAAITDLNSLEQLVQADLLQHAVLAAAKQSGFDHQPGTLAQLDQLRDQALVRLWIASKASVPADYPSEVDVQAAYSANQQALATPTQYHLLQIFISAPDGADSAKLTAALRMAEDIGSRLTSANFAQLAATESSSGPGGGSDLGYLPDNRMLPSVLAAVRTLQPGQFIGPVKTAQGLHFLKLLDKKPGAVPTLAQAHDQLVAALRSRRANQLAQAYLADYNTKLGVTVNQIELARLQQTLQR